MTAINIVKSFFVETNRWLNEYLFMKRTNLRLKMEIKMANVKHNITGKQYMVIPDPRSKYNMTNICVDQIQVMKKYSRIKKNDGKLELMNKAFYWTPVLRNGPALTPEERRRMEDNYSRYVGINPFAKAK